MATPRTQNRQEIRQKRLEYFQKNGIKSKAVPNGLGGQRAAVKDFVGPDIVADEESNGTADEDHMDDFHTHRPPGSPSDSVESEQPLRPRAAFTAEAIYDLASRCRQVSPPGRRPAEPTGVEADKVFQESRASIELDLSGLGIRTDSRLVVVCPECRHANAEGCTWCFGCGCCLAGCEPVNPNADLTAQSRSLPRKPRQPSPSVAKQPNTVANQSPRQPSLSVVSSHKSADRSSNLVAPSNESPGLPSHAVSRSNESSRQPSRLVSASNQSPGQPSDPVAPSNQSRGQPSDPVAPSNQSPGQPSDPVAPSNQSPGQPSGPVGPSNGSPRQPSDPVAPSSGSPWQPSNPVAISNGFAVQPSTDAKEVAHSFDSGSEIDDDDSRSSARLASAAAAELRQRQRLPAGLAAELRLDLRPMGVDACNKLQTDEFMDGKAALDAAEMPPPPPPPAPPAVTDHTPLIPCALLPEKRRFRRKASVQEVRQSGAQQQQPQQQQQSAPQFSRRWKSSSMSCSSTSVQVSSAPSGSSRQKQQQQQRQKVIPVQRHRNGAAVQETAEAAAAAAAASSARESLQRRRQHSDSQWLPDSSLVGGEHRVVSAAVGEDFGSGNGSVAVDRRNHMQMFDNDQAIVELAFTDRDGLFSEYSTLNALPISTQTAGYLAQCGWTKLDSPWLYLPEEVWLQVLQQLSLTDLTQVARTCRRLHRIANDKSLWCAIELAKRHDLTDADLAEIGSNRPVRLVINQCHGDLVTIGGVQQLLRCAGDFLQELSFTGNSRGAFVADQLLTVLAMYCPRVRYLDCSYAQGLSDCTLRALAEQLSELESVKLNGAQQLTDSGVADLLSVHGHRLRCLELYGCFKLSDRTAGSIGRLCPGLTQLSLGACPRVRPRAALQAVQSLDRLRSLDLRGMSGLTDDDLLPAWPRLASLRSLVLANCNRLTDRCLPLGLALPALRLLDLCGCQRLTSAALAQLCRAAPRLARLDLSSTGVCGRGLRALADSQAAAGCCLQELKLNFCRKLKQPELTALTASARSLSLLLLYGLEGIDIVELKAVGPAGLVIKADASGPQDS
ncbi:hypothetical protein BOX15_Mlig018172g2 [Macrostomum lignano]|uniref:F-box domain-containing protein n=2 Tax=Macrostomum lignano TaxID=282301 RepID=A0A267DK22_9PLAT|nr:hypothetical protein BOX15_Mlig018172g2 [Macrostomum lignano]